MVHGLPTDFPWGHAATPKTLPLAPWEFSLLTERMWGLSVKQLGINQAWQSVVWLGCLGLLGVEGLTANQRDKN